MSICKMVYDEMRYKYHIDQKIKITSPEDILQLKEVSDISDDNQENFLCITMNISAEVINVRTVTKGLVNHSLVHNREIFRDAILDTAISIICIHNHPSGNLEPSTQDLKITDDIKKAGDIIGISLLDHVIVSKNGIQSIRQLGYI